MKKKLIRAAISICVAAIFMVTMGVQTEKALAATETTGGFTEQQITITPSEPTEARADVIEHVETDKEGNQTNGSGNQENGKEFYTIQTDSEKIFYLVIDRKNGEEKVYFLTEIDEADLLNVTTDSNESIKGTGTIAESAIPGTNMEELDNLEPTEPENEKETGTEELSAVTTEEVNPVATYIFYGVVGVIAVGIGYYFKVYRKKKEEFIDEDEDEEDEVEEVSEEEDEETEDDFFNRDSEEEA